jgi:hypothetical protein
MCPSWPAINLSSRIVDNPIPHSDVAIAGGELVDADWYDFFRGLAQAVSPTAPVTLTYGPIINTNASLSSNFILTVTNTSPFTIAAPSNPTAGAVINYTVKNAAGANMGAVTWNAVFKVPTVPPSWKPPNGYNRSLQFFFDGTSWVLRYAGTEDVPN